MEVACVDVAAGRAQVRAKHGIGIVEGIHKGNGVWAEGEEEGGDGLGRGRRQGRREGRNGEKKESRCDYRPDLWRETSN